MGRVCRGQQGGGGVMVIRILLSNLLIWDLIARTLPNSTDFCTCHLIFVFSVSMTNAEDTVPKSATKGRGRALCSRVEIFQFFGFLGVYYKKLQVGVHCTV